jgi:hypothetical protein
MKRTPRLENKGLPSSPVVIRDQLNQLAETQKILMKILDKGGVTVVVGEEGVLVTAYNFSSNKYCH